MTDQASSSVQSVQTSKELRQRMLDQLDTNIAAIEELNDEELEAIGGGAGITSILKSVNDVMERRHGWDIASGIALSTFL